MYDVTFTSNRDNSGTVIYTANKSGRPPIFDYTSRHTGKWYEVLAYSTDRYDDETPDMLAKFKSLADALDYVKGTAQRYGGLTRLIVR